MISISLVPNLKFYDLAHFFDNRDLASVLAKYQNLKNVLLFESGRQAFYFLLKAISIGPGDEVIIQAFTCVAVANAITWTGATPVYGDIDATLNLDPRKLEKLINDKTKVVVVQHTFGRAADIQKIAQICRQKKIILLEDMAHGLGGNGDEKKLGTFGLASFYSFGRDKVVSGIWGGAVATDDEQIFQKLKNLTKDLPIRGLSWTIKQMVYPILIFLTIYTYDFLGLGKLLHWLLRRGNFLPKVITQDEKEGLKPAVFYQGLPRPLANLAAYQMTNLENFITHRQKLARFYAESLCESFEEKVSYLRYNLFVSDPESLRRFAARRNIFLGDWYDQVVAPKTVHLPTVGYKAGSCPVAERVCREIVNLPTNPNLSLFDAQKIVDVINIWKLKK